MKDYKIIMNFAEIFSKILDCIYYRKCYLCSQKCYDISLCKNCLDKINSNLNFHHAQKFNTNIYCAAAYENEIVKIIRALKYHKKSEFEKILTEMIIQTINHYNLELDNFIICPVPIHKNRFKHRKYNHMQLVAQELGKILNLKTEANFLKRIKDTPPLYKLSAAERMKYLDGAFEASSEIKGKKILLIDDIITSGATVKELSKIIYAQNPQELLVLCATRSNNCNF